MESTAGEIGERVETEEAPVRWIGIEVRIREMRHDYRQRAARFHHPRELADEPGEIVDVLEEMVTCDCVDTCARELRQHLKRVADEIDAIEIECIDPDGLGVALDGSASELECDAWHLSKAPEDLLAVENGHETRWLGERAAGAIRPASRPRRRGRYRRRCMVSYFVRYVAPAHVPSLALLPTDIGTLITTPAAWRLHRRAMRTDLLMLSRYGPLGASSRMRSYQYIDALREAGISVEIRPLFDDAYVAARHRGRGLPPVARVVAGYLHRLDAMRAARQAHALWIEYELLPWLPFGIERWIYARHPVIVDYDDAIFHRYGLHRWQPVRSLLGRKIDRIMAAASVVVAGNEYLAERARGAGARRVEVVPTVIDLARYRQKVGSRDSRRLAIGWIGSPSTVAYLRQLEPVLRAIGGETNPRVVNVGGTPWMAAGLDIDNLPWSAESEVAAMLEFDVGIMPLPDEPWARGKCGYKLIQYMGCALPAIASPVGINASIIEHGKTGFLASTSDEWRSALQALASSAELRTGMGRAGFARACERYSLAVTAPKVVDLVRSQLTARRP